ncbi:MAG: anthranilate synthase component I family protein [Desulfitobacteriaceae bacterium]
MWTATMRWNVPRPEEINGAGVLQLANLGEGLGQSCRFVLEGQERENERSYLGFGEGWVFSGIGHQERDPLPELRKILEWQKSWRDVATGENQRLESGLVGYLDYEWGLVWQRPAATLAQPTYFFRACPINLIWLPGEGRLVLEILGDEKERVESERLRWGQVLEEFLSSGITASEKPIKSQGAFAKTAEGQNTGKDVSEGRNVSESINVSEGRNEFKEEPAGFARSNGLDGLQANWHSNMSREYFLQQVRRIQEYIRAGDVFQAVFSQRFSRQGHCSPWEVYRRLRLLNPSPYLFFLEGEGEVLVGSSPELLVSTSGKRVFTRPIAGTRRRGTDFAEDVALERELSSDEKEGAEHAMLVDLGRNDIGRVAVYGSVLVSQYAEVERFSHVMHLVSTVEGELAEGSDGLAALQAVFPAGTLTGAPKVRAMEILKDLEPAERGAYGGALGILRWNGDVDFCITIRTLRVKADEVSVQAGGGIVLDSQPELEYEETVHKAQALMQVVNEIANSH